ncbi:MAG: hypothetical protein HC772_06030 [Leptolyngbyaceae cyanobacterium CRU_2_3]|nr:hypothetical protein [Leptolyngbyaceae cyanobacterium CRU_2_3]
MLTPSEVVAASNRMGYFAMPDLRDNTPNTARVLKLNALSQTFKDQVGGRDRHDYYSFKLRQRSSFNLSLRGLQANAEVELLSDRNRDGRLDSSEQVAASKQLGKRKEAMALTLDPGNYHIRVFSATRLDQTHYSLSTSAASLGQFQAKYYSNANLSGQPALTEYLGDGSLKFSRDWTTGWPTSPSNHPSNHPSNSFSARFTTERSLSPGLYQVKVLSNDGVRVKVGKQIVIDQWADQAYLPHSGYFYADGKKTLPIRVEYFNKNENNSELDSNSPGNREKPAIDFEIIPVTPFQDGNSSTQWKSQWKTTLFAWDDSQNDSPSVNFADQGLGNPQAIGVLNLGSNIRSDGKPGIQFDWGTDTYVSDGYRLPHDTFAMQATTTAEFDGSLYKFRVKGDDGFQIFAKPQKGGKTYAITPKKQWVQGVNTEQEITYKLPAGSYDLTFNYFEKRNLANFDLSWEKVLQTSPLPNANPTQPDSSSLWDSPLHGYPLTSPYGQRTYQTVAKQSQDFIEALI